MVEILSPKPELEQLGTVRELSEKSVPLLVNVLKDGGEEEKLQPMAAIQEYGPLAEEAIEPLIDELKRFEKYNPRWLRPEYNPKSALIMIGPKSITPLIEILKNASQPFMRRRAAQMLGAFLHKTISGEVRRRLWGFLAEISLRNDEIISVLKYAADNDPDDSVRYRANKGLRNVKTLNS